MVSIRPVQHALVPGDSTAATAVSAPNYDEFQSDLEVFAMLRPRPDNILKVTMPHTAVTAPSLFLEEGGEEALSLARVNLDHLKGHPQMRHRRGVLYLYELTHRDHPDMRQIGLGGSALTKEIRTDEQPDGVIIRNEGIRPEKAEGRAHLINATQSYIGTVNLTVQDRDGSFVATMESIADGREPDFETLDEDKHRHRVWIIDEADQIATLTDALAKQPAAYVADGNHRSAAAAALGRDDFLAVFFTTGRMGLAPYNRLVRPTGLSDAEVAQRLAESFDIDPAPSQPYQPTEIHDIGLYLAGTWHRLRPKAGTFDPARADESIDSDIVQRKLLDGVLGLSDPKDKRINFVGGNKDAAWLQRQVDEGDDQLAITLAPVTMDQFVAVCEQGVFMPPKSTWFEPKIRSGLVVSLFEGS